MTKIYKNIVTYALALLLVAPVFVVATSVNAQATLDPWGGQEQAVQEGTGLGAKDPQAIAASIINLLLGFLGIIAVVIILMGGFKWMTAGGAEDKVEEAKKLISAGVIGLVIILAAFGLAQFIVRAVMNATQ